MPGHLFPAVLRGNAPFTGPFHGGSAKMFFYRHSQCFTCDQSKPVIKTRNISVKSLKPIGFLLHKACSSSMYLLSIMKNYKPAYREIEYLVPSVYFCLIFSNLLKRTNYYWYLYCILSESQIHPPHNNAAIWRRRDFIISFVQWFEI